MKATITPSVLKGEIKAPPSKSMAHRLLISAGLSKGASVISSVAYSEDILATLDCLRVMGADIKEDKDTVTIKGASPFINEERVFSARESGSTLRFFVPILLLSEKMQTFKGYGRLMERPMSVYSEICREKGLYFSQENGTLKCKGKLEGGNFTVKGDISSQFISGLLFALPLSSENSTIELIPPVESMDYINMTIDAMKSFGVEIKWQNETTLFVKGNQKYESRNLSVEGDYSNAAFIESFNLFGGEVKTTGLNENSLQGDKVYREYFKKLNEGTPTLDVRNCPDLAPILMTVASMKNGAVLTGTRRLKIKESDRAEVMKKELSKFGAKITVKENEVIIEKTDLHPPKETLYAHNDHRVAMSLSVIASLYGGTIEGAECVKKSYPDFFEQMKKLGLEVKLSDD
ncbi:MAG: 3-phosphoshikimate 1-carboxyvinyltransferase [Clostridia bacterium]|nr:3-phosphoshikimate 1-carboxyvinyltransferase [Clostridia bacterium]